MTRLEALEAVAEAAHEVAQLPYRKSDWPVVRDLVEALNRLDALPDEGAPEEGAFSESNTEKVDAMMREAWQRMLPEPQQPTVRVLAVGMCDACWGTGLLAAPDDNDAHRVCSCVRAVDIRVEGE